MAKKFVIGIDEVGRGCLAGPVTVAAVAVLKAGEWKRLYPRLVSKMKLKDSKNLSPLKREEWFRWIKENGNGIFYATANVSPKIIDKINIFEASNLAATNVCSKLIANYRIKKCEIFLDGGLRLNKIKDKKLKFKTIIRGDETIPAIMLASIVAKVKRDNLMRRMSEIYPRYKFEEHKGYGTKHHFRAIKKFGLTPIHRRSFILKSY